LRSAASSFLRDVRGDLQRSGVAAALRERDTPRLFNWLMTTLSYQGISDRVAASFIESHGQVSWSDLRRAVQKDAGCNKLKSFWQFENCGYRKDASSCSEPRLLSACGVPKFPLRNGRLNQTAASLYLFIRDVTGGDFADWISNEIDQRKAMPAKERVSDLIDCMKGIYGASDKMLSMLLSSLLLSSPQKKLWFETGASCVVVDTLLHNFLHRSGVLEAMQKPHAYGPLCYAPGGCCDAVHLAAAEIDARAVSADFPEHFPRLVQHALWRFCAQDALDICNGNRIDDRERCQNAYCPEFLRCRRMPINNRKRPC
jgi:hypothetical protein